jgi:GLPGLI family protein
MKKYLLAIVVCASWAFVSNNLSEGVITYTVKTNMHKRIPPEQEEIKKMMPEWAEVENLLIFNDSESLFKPVAPDENVFDNQSADGTMRVMRRIQQNEYYANRDTGILTQLREFMGKNYLIKKESERIPWKLGSESKEILGYKCKNAFYTDEVQREIVAWYTEEIRMPIGPEKYQGLPGLILEVSINTDDQIFSATKIDFRTLKKNELKEPKNGKELSEEEYRAMVQEQMEKMGAQSGQGGFRMMIRN